MMIKRTSAHPILFPPRRLGAAAKSGEVSTGRPGLGWLRSGLWAVGIVLASASFGSTSSAALAAPAVCEAAIARCSLADRDDATSDAEVAVTEARQACRALRSCDKVCGVDDFEPWPAPEEPSCRTQCRGKRRRARRQCVRTCRTTRERVRTIAVVTAKRSQQRCVAQCRRQYKTPGCQVARQRAVATLTQEGLQCAPNVSDACTPHVLN